MKRLGLAYALLFAAGCTGKPCDTTSQCGSGEVCASAHCQALSCDSTYFALNPDDGTCRPLPACGNRDDVRGWAGCDNPCTAMGENACIADTRCQPVYTTDSSAVCTNTGQPVAIPAGGFGNVGCGGPRTFAGCRANPLRVDPCAGLDEAGCKSNPACVGSATIGGCNCPPGSDCACPVDDGNGGGWECRLASCGDFQTNSECKRHSECSSNPPVFNSSGGEGIPPFPVDAGVPGPTSADEPFQGCFDKSFGSCFDMDEGTCLSHSECHPVGSTCYCAPGTTCVCGGGKFLFCEPDDGLTRCNNNSECGADQRCNNDEQCAPAVGTAGTVGFGVAGAGGGPIPPGSGLTTSSTPTPPAACAGLCVPKGCSGNGENRCVGDPSCDPIYLLACSPYGGGGDFFGGGACGNALPAEDASGAPIIMTSCPPCEPSFIQCVDRTVGTVVDPDKSVLNRQPHVIDAPMFAFANVMTRLAGSQDAAGFVDGWLAQITAASTAENGKVAAARPSAAAYFATLPRLADGRLDLAQIGFQVTSLSNRIDLAGPHDCGEARITYALKGGVTDRRHRMTVIVELKQPDDGTACTATARSWVALSALEGDALRLAEEAIYQPLLAPAHLGQVRTNEFLVGNDVSTDPASPQIPWELREWRLGADGGLHLAPSKQALDPALATDTLFRNWLDSNTSAVEQQRAIIPDQFLAVASSENGGRITLNAQTSDDGLMEQSLNLMACAGCHTTETNSAFAHVGERFNGNGRAKISDFLRKALPTRADLLFRISMGRLDQSLRTAVKPVH